MAFSEDVRNELAAIAPAKKCDRLAELSALFHGAGSFHLRAGHDVSVELDLGSTAVARRAFSLLRSFGVTMIADRYSRPEIGEYGCRSSANARRCASDQRDLAG